MFFTVQTWCEVKKSNTDRHKWRWYAKIRALFLFLKRRRQKTYGVFRYPNHPIKKCMNEGRKTAVFSLWLAFSKCVIIFPCWIKQRNTDGKSAEKQHFLISQEGGIRYGSFQSWTQYGLHRYEQPSPTQSVDYLESQGSIIANAVFTGKLGLYPGRAVSHQPNLKHGTPNVSCLQYHPLWNCF